MLRRTFTAVVERNVQLTDGFVTEPYETGWAIEARWFIHILEADAGARIAVSSEVSPDGLAWCEHEAEPVEITGEGLLTLPLANIGPWQRLRFSISGAENVRGLCYLTLKG